MVPLFGYSVPLYVPLLALIAVGLLARRFRVIGTLLSVATWAVMALVLVVLVSERGRFDPSLGRIAALFDLD